MNARTQKALESPVAELLLLDLTRLGGRFKLVVGSREYQQNTCDFLLTFASMQGKNMEEYVNNLDADHDTVRVPISGCGRAVTLSLSDFARLRSLYGQRMFELKLEDLLMRQGIESSVQAGASSATMNCCESRLALN